jgi:hypothetical protein
MKEHPPRGVWLKGASVLVGLSMAAGMTLTQVGTANALSVGANISGSGSGKPLIECSWIVGDHNPAGGSETEQYNYPLGEIIDPGGNAALKNWTLSSSTPDYPGSGPTPPSFGTSPVGTSFVYGEDGPNLGTAPCTLGTNGATMAAGSQAAPTASGVAFNINPFDSATGSWVSDPGPAPKRVELWAAVDYATNVIFDVFYPNTNEDTEVGGVQIGGANNACTSWNTSGTLLDGMFGAAGPGEDNELASNAIENTSSTGIVDKCNENQKSLWHQAFTISKDDPSGLYSVEVKAVSATGNSVSWFSFTVSPSIDLATDFTSVDFASNNGVYEISGDTVYNTAYTTACDQGATLPAGVTTCQAPTVINGGNEGLEVGIAYQPLTTSIAGSNYLLDGPIFDANLGYTASYMLATDPIVNAGTTVGAYGPTTWLTNNAGAAATLGQLVCPNDDPKLDLSLDPPVGTPQGWYSGTMEVLAQADPVVGAGAGGCLTDNKAPYIINGAYKSVTDLDAPPLTRS